MKRLFSGWREPVWVTLAYAVTATGMTYPLLFQIQNGVASHSPDVWILLWDNWWVQHALSSGQNIFYTANMFYPQGVSLAAHSFSFTHTAVSSLFQLFTDPIAAYNLAIWLTFPISGLGMYLLCKRLVGSRPAAWIGGLLYAFAPYHMTQALGHPHLSYVQFIPFAVLFILKTIESPRARYVVVAIGFLVLTAYAGPHLLVVTLAWLAIFLPFDFIAHRRRITWPVSIALGSVLLGVMVLSLPLVLPAAADIAHGQSIQQLQTGEFDDTQTDVLAYFLPTRYHPLFGSALEATYRDLGKNYLWMPYLGWMAILLSVIGVIAQRRRALGWTVSALACLLLALGPELRMNGVTYANIPLPFALLQNIFPFSFLRSPDRFNIIVSLPLAVLAAYGFAALLQHLVTRRARTIAAVIVSLIILFEYLNVPYPMMPLPDTSPFVAQMAGAAEPSALLDLPMGRNPAKTYLYWQTVHLQPLVEGHVSRTPDHAYDFIEGNAVLRALRQPGESTLDEAQRAAALRELARQDIRYIIIHLPMTGVEQLDQYRAILGLAPIYSDELVEVYAVPQ